jgi:hypothetical protein
VLRSGLEAVSFDPFAQQSGGDGNTHGNTRRSDARRVAGVSEPSWTGRNTPTLASGRGCRGDLVEMVGARGLQAAITS